MLYKLKITRALKRALIGHLWFKKIVAIVKMIFVWFPNAYPFKINVRKVISRTFKSL